MKFIIEIAIAKGGKGGGGEKKNKTEYIGYNFSYAF